MTQELTTPQPVQIRVLEELKKDNRLPALVAAVESVEKAPEVIKNQVADKFIPEFTQIEKACAGFREFVVTDETETGKMFEAATKAKILKVLKRALENKYNIEKENCRREGQAYDAVRRAGDAELTPAIAHYEAQAEYIERKEAARVEALRSERYALILPYLVPEILPTPYPVWGEMHEDDFQATLAAAKEKARQIEAERVARTEKERAEQKELERLRVENERQARELAEARRINAQQTIQEVRVALDPIPAPEPETPIQQTDREKLRAYSLALLQLPFPTIQDPEMRKVLQGMRILLNKIDLYVEEKTAQ